MRKTVTIAAVAALCVTAPAFAQSTPRSGTNNPTATHTNPSSCLGAERATRNSNGGDRAKGQFGKEQSALARQQAQDNVQGGYGQQTLKPFMQNCTHAPGATGNNGTTDEANPQ